MDTNEMNAYSWISKNEPQLSLGWHQEEPDVHLCIVKVLEIMFLNPTLKKKKQESIKIKYVRHFINGYQKFPLC